MDQGLANLTTDADETWPADNFGVYVDGEMDRLRLGWLVAEIGENKLRSSVAKYNLRYPDCLPFVSLLLKWYRLKVPTEVYAPKRVPIFGAYILVVSDGQALKIGMSGTWTTRANSMLGINGDAARYFDLDHSVFGAVQSKKMALDLEGALLEATLDAKCAVPLGIPWGAGGKQEWRTRTCLSKLLSILEDRTNGAPLLTLRQALEHQRMVFERDAENTSS